MLNTLAIMIYAASGVTIALSATNNLINVIHSYV
jgi:hypothetical protein